MFSTTLLLATFAMAANAQCPPGYAEQTAFPFTPTSFQVSDGKVTNPEGVFTDEDTQRILNTTSSVLGTEPDWNNTMLDTDGWFIMDQIKSNNTDNMTNTTNMTNASNMTNTTGFYGIFQFTTGWSATEISAIKNAIQSIKLKARFLGAMGSWNPWRFAIKVSAVPNATSSYQEIANNNAASDWLWSDITGEISTTDITGEVLDNSGNVFVSYSTNEGKIDASFLDKVTLSVVTAAPVANVSQCVLLDKCTENNGGCGVGVNCTNGGLVFEEPTCFCADINYTYNATTNACELPAENTTMLSSTSMPVTSSVMPSSVIPSSVATTIAASTSTSVATTTSDLAATTSPGLGATILASVTAAVLSIAVSNLC
eukprot:Pgem_evm1s2770